VAAEHFLAILFDRSARHVLNRYVLHFGRCLEGMLLIKRSNVISGLEHLRTGTDELRDTGFTPDYPTFLGAMAEGLAWLAFSLIAVGELQRRRTGKQEGDNSPLVL